MRTVGAALVSLSLAVGCNSAKSKTAAASNTSISRVEVVRVVAEPLNIEVRLPGELQPYESVAVFPKISGFVDRISVDRGSRVKTGQLMARLSAPEIASQRAEAHSKADAAQSEIATAQAKLVADQNTYEKLKAAAQTPGVVAGNDLLQAQKLVDADQAQVQAAQRIAEAAKQGLQAVTATEQYLRI